LRCIDNKEDIHVSRDFRSIQQKDAIRNILEEGKTRNMLQLANNYLNKKINMIPRCPQPKFVDCPVDWYRTSRTTNGEGFLTHLLLSLGQFTTELELFSQGSLTKSFIFARLFTDSENTTDKEESTRFLLNQFVKKQLFHLHAGMRTFDHQLVCADKLLTDFFVHDRITDIAISAALYSRIKQETTRDVKDYCNKPQAKLLKGLLYRLGILFDNLPTHKNVMEATFENPINFNPELLLKPNDQSKASAKEHKGF
jgi:hypothetical protein